MTIKERIQICCLLEKMEEQKEYSEKLGLVNVSKFHNNTKTEKGKEGL